MTGPSLLPRSPREPARRTGGTRRPRAGAFLLGAYALATALSLAAGLLRPAALAAQQPADARLRGEVVKDGEPVDQGTVVLHRVTREDAGEVDSARLGADGRFEFLLPDVPDPEDRRDVYFASIRYQGIFYFGAAVTRAAQLDSLYRIEVHDTVGAPPGGADLPVSHRTVFLEEGEGGWEVTDLFELRNERGRTVVAPEGGTTWSHPLPEEGRDFRTGQGDFPPDAVVFAEGEVRVSAPMPPGRRVFVIRYAVPALDLTVPLPGTTEVMELLIREPAPAVEVTRLEAAPPVELEPGSTYRTFSAENLVDTRIRVRPGGGEDGFPVEWLAVILALVLAVAGLAAVKLGRRERPPGGKGGVVPQGADRGDPDASSAGSTGSTGSTGPAPSGPGSPEQPGEGPSPRRELILEIARLDEAFEAKDDPSPEEEARYRARREELLERLASRE